MRRISGWKSGDGDFVIRRDDKIETVNSQEFDRVSSQVCEDIFEGKCVLYPFLCPNCAGWVATYSA